LFTVLALLAVLLAGGYGVSRLVSSFSAATQGGHSTGKLAERSFQTGRCYTWHAAARATAVTVSCDRRHLFQAVGYRNLPTFSAHAAYPSPGQWDAIDLRYCEPLASAFLGYPLDVGGRFGPTSLHPDAASWRAGDRRLVCGITLRWSAIRGLAGADQMLAFTGSVKGAQQARLFPARACVLQYPGGLLRPVACSQPHTAVVTGTATSTIASRQPPAVATFGRAAAPVCKTLATRLLGQPLRSPYRAGWIAITPTGWLAGERLFNCVLERA
jgi:hypothetical protein